MASWLRPVLWGLLAVVLIVMGRVMLSACGVSLFGFSLGFCQPAATSSVSEVAILAQVAQDLELRLAGAQQSCQAPGGLTIDGTAERPIGEGSGPGQSQGPAGNGLLPVPDESATGTAPAEGGPSGSGAPASGGEGTAGDGTSPAPGDATPPPGEDGQGSAGSEPGAGDGDGSVPEGGASESPPDPQPAEGEDSPSSPSEPSSGPQSSAEEPSSASSQAPEPSAEPASDGSDCPAQTQERSPPPIVLALDRSKSMGLPADIDAATVAGLDELIASDDADAAWAAQMLYNDMVAQPGRKRLDDLKQSVAEATAERVPAALISFAGCTAGVEDHGSFSTEQRELFLGQVNGLQTTPATPLAEAITAATERARRLSSAEARVLLVSDGLDTCGGDPCAAAANSGGIPIDVIAIGGQAPLTCVSDNSGGTMFSQSSGASLAQLLSEALAPPTPSSEC